jgi:acylphosphatase
MAFELGVTGWVRNRPDGSVETVGQGGPEVLERFVERLHEGPPLARVSRVDTDWRDADEPFSRFSVVG